MTLCLELVTFFVMLNYVPQGITYFTLCGAPAPRFVVVQALSRARLCNPTNCSTPGFPVVHHLPEFAQTHVHLSQWCHPSTAKVINLNNWEIKEQRWLFQLSPKHNFSIFFPGPSFVLYDTGYYIQSYRNIKSISFKCLSASKRRWKYLSPGAPEVFRDPGICIDSSPDSLCSKIIYT